MDKVFYLVVDEFFKVIGSFLSDKAVNYLDDIEEDVLKHLGINTDSTVHILRVGSTAHAVTLADGLHSPEEDKTSPSGKTGTTPKKIS